MLSLAWEHALSVLISSPLMSSPLKSSLLKSSRPSLCASRSPSAVRPPEHVHQLGDLAPLLCAAAGRDGAVDAMRHVIAQHLLLDLAQRRAHRADLGDDVDTVAVAFDHARQAAHLPFDALQ